MDLFISIIYRSIYVSSIIYLYLSLSSIYIYLYLSMYLSSIYIYHLSLSIIYHRHHHLIIIIYFYHHLSINLSKVLWTNVELPISLLNNWLNKTFDTSLFYITWQTWFYLFKSQTFIILEEPRKLPYQSSTPHGLRGQGTSFLGA